MDLQYTLECYALQLKNQPRTLSRVAGVFQKIMKTLYDAYFPNAKARRPGPNPDCPDSDILTIAWLLEYIGADSELSGYQRIRPMSLSWIVSRSRSAISNGQSLQSLILSGRMPREPSQLMETVLRKVSALFSVFAGV